MRCPRYQDCKGGAVLLRLLRLCANSMILPGVEIGEGALVGTGSLVAGHVPPYAEPEPPAPRRAPGASGSARFRAVRRLAGSPFSQASNSLLGTPD